MRAMLVYPLFSNSLGLQIAKNRPYLHTLGPKVSIIDIHGALGINSLESFFTVAFHLPGLYCHLGAVLAAAKKHAKDIPKAPCNCIVDTRAFKHLPYHNFGAYACTIRLLGAFGYVAEFVIVRGVSVDFACPRSSPYHLSGSTLP